jgi:hypothetical protein
MKSAGVIVGMLCLICYDLLGQVDTSFVYNTSTPYGTLDIRIAKSSSRYYYLKEGTTFNYRESGGQETRSYFDMTSWDSSPYSQGSLREKNGKSDYFIMNYRLLFPSNYNRTYGEGYPLIIMMHGAGERGNCWNNTCYHGDRTWKPLTNNPPAPDDPTSKLLNNDHNLLHGGKVHLDARNLAGARLPNDPSMPGRAFPGFVLFPQNLNGWDANAVQDAIKLIRLVAKKYNIDEDRIYIHGLSNGGGGLYQALKRAPWLFAAALPMSAADDGGITSKNLQSTIAHIPMWMFQGGQDTNPTVRETEGYISKYRSAGAVVRYSLYPELGHGTWNTAYNEGDFFKWILAQNKSRIHLYAGSNAICLTNGQGVRMEVAKGFRKYQWEKNGIIISGATSSSYVATSTGKYRARFSRVANPQSSDWNQWSDYVTVTQQSPAKPEIEQIGTVLLKDLNYYGNARLKSASSADHYYWYKNGTLVNLSGSQDDTVSTATFFPGSCTSTSCTNNGKYTLVTKSADGCPSPPSDPISVYFNNLAPVTVSAPTNFKGAIASLTTVRLSWTDASSNERGFEIWRRQAIGTSYSKWEMRAITNANVTTFTDSGLEPETKYHYKIRAVSSSARSNYTPAASNAYLVINTNEDTVGPSAPQTLSAKKTGIGEVYLSWKASTDNTGIRQYKIYYDGKVVNTGDNETNFTLSDLPINKTFSMYVKAEDLGGNIGGQSNIVSINTYVDGLYYEHSTGSWTDLDQISWTALPEFTGTVNNFTLAPRTQEDFFNFEFYGYLYINTSGSYKFRTISSDGSRLQIGNAVIVNNDGIHANRTITSAAQTLNSGSHEINLKYFEYDGSQTLIVQYYGPDSGNKWINIPDGALRSGNSNSGARIASAELTAEPESDSLTSAFEVNIFPNPTVADNINLSFKSEMTEAPIQVIVVDFTGRELFRKTLQSDEWQDGLRVVPVEEMNKGVYLIRINQGNNIKTERLMINR